MSPYLSAAKTLVEITRQRDEAVTALRSLRIADDAHCVYYADNEIRIRCDSHWDAISRVLEARKVLARAEATP